MSDLNVCTFTGRLTRDAEQKLIGAKQTPCVEFSVANNTGYGDYAKTTYIDVQLWGSGNSGVVPYLKKGQQIGVSGTLTQNDWVDTNGVKHTKFRLSAMGVTLLASPQGSSQNTNAGAYKARAQEIAAQAMARMSGEEETVF